MKKTYFAPELKVIKIATVGMIANSFKLNNNPTGTEGDPDKSLGRRGSTWDDEE